MDSLQLGNVDQALSLLKSLANKHRLMILCHLVEGELSVGQLNQSVPLSQSALSQHLAWLRRENLVSTRKDAQTIYYRLYSEEAKSVLQLLHQMFCAK
ncbi:ArsR/SmtB family transcription factor [Celerinatantimonas sp. YJH-8]|uniref:ArsR/SmtB family transcription factor n=1 Tax=Celerinatantimonas sp. YJH-8 TaxID=3228714 RepID=UPI0038C10136